MAITKLNNVLVKHGKVMFGIITAIIIVAFVWFFTPGADGSILFGSDPNSPDAVCGEVFGKKIQNRDITDAMKAYVLFNSAMAGVAPDQARINITFERAYHIAERCKLAEKWGLVVSDDEVGRAVRTYFPAFQKNGKFDMEAYKAYEKKCLLPKGYSIKDFENAVRAVLTATMLPDLLDSGVVSPSEQAEFCKDSLEKIESLNIVFPLEYFKKGIKPTEAELLAFYNSNKAQFLSPVKYQGETVVFLFSDYKVDAKAAKAEYEKSKAGLFNPNGSPMTYDQFVQRKQIELARKDARAFREKVYKATETIAGDKAAYLAEYQKLAQGQKRRVNISWFDSSSKQLAGLGAEDSLKFALIKKAGENSPVTDPVMGKNAFYVAAVTGVRPAEQLDFKAAKADVLKIYVEQKAAAKMKEAVAKFRADVALAKKNNVKIDEKKLKEFAPFADITVFPAVRKLEIIQQFSSLQFLRSQQPELYQLMATDLMYAFVLCETKVGELTQEYYFANGSAVKFSFVTKRTPATEDEIKAGSGMLAMLHSGQKKNMVLSAADEWIEKNSKNYVQLKQQAGQQGAPAGK